MDFIVFTLSIVGGAVVLFYTFMAFEQPVATFFESVYQAMFGDERLGQDERFMRPVSNNRRENINDNNNNPVPVQRTPSGSSRLNAPVTNPLDMCPSRTIRVRFDPTDVISVGHLSIVVLQFLDQNNFPHTLNLDFVKCIRIEKTFDNNTACLFHEASSDRTEIRGYFVSHESGRHVFNVFVNEVPLPINPFAIDVLPRPTFATLTVVSQDYLDDVENANVIKNNVEDVIDSKPSSSRADKYLRLDDTDSQITDTTESESLNVDSKEKTYKVGANSYHQHHRVSSGMEANR